MKNEVELKSNYLNKVKMNNRVPIHKHIFSLGYSSIVSSLLSIGLGVSLFSINWFIITLVLGILIKLLLEGASDSYRPEFLDNTTTYSKIINLLNPSIQKKLEQYLKHFSDIGYYFDLDLNFLKNFSVDSFLSFQNNNSLKEFINLIVYDEELSKEYVKIAMISKDSDFIKLDSEVKQSIISNRVFRLVELSLSKIIEHNENSKNKIRLAVDSPKKNMIIENIAYLKGEYVFRFKKLNIDSKNIYDPEAISIFLDKEILSTAMKNYDYINYKELLNILITKLESKLDKKILTSDDLLELEETIVNKYYK